MALDEAEQRSPSDDYRVLRPLHQGAQFRIDLAELRREGQIRRVALKRPQPWHSGSFSHLAALQNAGALMSYLRSANLATLVDAGPDHLAYDFIEGSTLEELCRGGSLPIPVLVCIIADALGALDVMHTATRTDGTPLRLVHQAPSARHIMVGSDGYARLIDLTSARWQGGEAGAFTPATERYLAPEHSAEGATIDFRADLFVVGATMWEALTGCALDERLGDAVAVEHRSQGVPKPSSVNPAVPAFLDEFCLVALEPHPAHRFRSAAEMSRELRAIASTHGVWGSSTDVSSWLRRAAPSLLVESREPPRHRPQLRQSRDEAEGDLEFPDIEGARKPQPSDPASEKPSAALAAFDLDNGLTPLTAADFARANAADRRLANRSRGKAVARASLVVAASLLGVWGWLSRTGDAHAETAEAAICLPATSSAPSPMASDALAAESVEAIEPPQNDDVVEAHPSVAQRDDEEPRGLGSRPERSKAPVKRAKLGSRRPARTPSPDQRARRPEASTPSTPRSAKALEWLSDTSSREWAGRGGGSSGGPAVSARPSEAIPPNPY